MSDQFDYASSILNTYTNTHTHTHAIYVSTFSNSPGLLINVETVLLFCVNTHITKCLIKSKLYVYSLLIRWVVHGGYVICYEQKG